MYQYPNCGFRVVLHSGYERIDSAAGSGTIFKDLRGLHLLIATALVRKKGRLTPAEFKFLRKEIGYPQTKLAELFAVQGQTVSLWERGESEFSVSQDVALRFLVADKLHVETGPVENVLSSAKSRAPLDYTIDARFEDGRWEILKKAARNVIREFFFEIVERDQFITARHPSPARPIEKHFIVDVPAFSCPAAAYA